MMHRRRFLGMAGALATGAFLVRHDVLLGNRLLSQGKAPVALPHFASRLHAFVWRNWFLVPLERLAAVVKTTPEEIRAVGKSLGLPEPADISADQWRRSYITIIRRNWHLLPESQLTQLLDWTAEQLEFTLQEDDFLFIKLGSLKPDCLPLVYESGESVSNTGADWVTRVLSEEFPQGLSEQEEPLFGFVKTLSEFPDTSPTLSEKSSFSPRYGYAYFTLFGDPLLEPDVDPYPPGYLARMAASGMSGTWLHIVLSKLTPFPWEPSLSKDWEKRLSNLAKLVARCKESGIGIYLYLNEPRYQPLSFFEKYPNLKGVTRGKQASLCTSHPDVQEYLVDSIAHITSVVPGLAGFFSITASENPTNCWSHKQGADCPRCGKRGAAEVIAELNTLYREGIRRGFESVQRQQNMVGLKEPELIVWDWGWPDGWAEEIIPQLPKDVSHMSVSEWDLPVERGGVATKVGEYSISVVGPGPRARRHWDIALKHGIKTIAKIQAGNTWEMAAVPYIPALENVAQHAVNLREAGVSGLMLGWTLGGYPSPNLEVVAAVGGDEKITVQEALEKVAEARYGSAKDAVVTAWQAYSKAFREFPYHQSVVYNAPLQAGPSNLLWDTPTGYRSTMVGIGYDDLTHWRSLFPEDVFIKQLYKVADGFEQALGQLKRQTAELNLEIRERSALQEDFQVAETVAIHYRSVANQASFILDRDALLQQPATAERQELVSHLHQLLDDEIDLAKRMYGLQCRNSMLGFEASNHYFYVPADLVEKVLNCRYLKEYWLS